MKFNISVLSMFLVCIILLSSCSSSVAITNPTTNNENNESKYTKYTHTYIMTRRVDHEQALVVSGWTNSSKIPLKNAYQDTHNGGSDGFVTKISPDGDILWSSYFGGAGTEYIHDMYINNQNEIWIAGWTDSNDMDTTLVTSGSQEQSWFFYIAKFTSDGQIIKIFRYDLPVPYFFNEHVKKVYLSENHFLIFAAVPEGLEGNEMRKKLPRINPLTENQEGNMYLYFADMQGQAISSGFFGGSKDKRDKIRDALISPDHEQVYLIGQTFSADFPVRNAFQEEISKNGKSDAFISCFDFKGTLKWSSYLGGHQEDYAENILVDSEGRLFVTGRTESDNFPLKNPQIFLEEKLTFNPEYRRGYSFLSIFSRDGELLSSTYLRESLPVTSYSFDSMNDHQNISFHGIGLFFDFHKEFRSVNEFQKGPLGTEETNETVASSNTIGSINANGQYTFYSFYGGSGLSAEAEDKATRRFKVSSSILNNNNQLFVIGSLSNLIPERFEHLKLDPVVFSVPKTHTLAFVSIFDTEGNFKKMLLWGAEE